MYKKYFNWANFLRYLYINISIPMKIIYNKIIPFKGYKAINLFGCLFVREEAKERLRDVDINHESIHSEQYKDLLYIFFLPLYCLEWLVKFLFVYWNPHKAYKNISFEREAYGNQSDMSYIATRKRFCWLKRIFS